MKNSVEQNRMVQALGYDKQILPSTVGGLFTSSSLEECSSIESCLQSETVVFNCLLVCMSFTCDGILHTGQSLSTTFSAQVLEFNINDNEITCHMPKRLTRTLNLLVYKLTENIGVQIKRK